MLVERCERRAVRSALVPVDLLGRDDVIDHLALGAAMHALVDIVRASGYPPRTITGDTGSEIAGTLGMLQSYIENALARQRGLKKKPNKKSR
jgi:hypothetical protein